MKPETEEGPPSGDNRQTRREPYRLADLEGRLDRALALASELLEELEAIRDGARRARERAQMRAEIVADATAPPGTQE